MYIRKISGDERIKLLFGDDLKHWEGLFACFHEIQIGL